MIIKNSVMEIVKILVVFLNTNGTKCRLKYFLTMSSLGLAGDPAYLKQQNISLRLSITLLLSRAKAGKNIQI